MQPIHHEAITPDPNNVADLERQSLKAQALTALREARFADYDAAWKAYYEAGGTDDLESEVCNIVSAEIEQGLYK